MICCHRCNGRNRRWTKEIKCIRNELSKKRNTLPVITYHTFPPEVVEKFNALLPKKKFQNHAFIDEFIKYWFDKRRTKNGIPLISTLQSSYKIKFIGNDHNRAVTENKVSRSITLKILYYDNKTSELKFFTVSNVYSEKRCDIVDLHIKIHVID